MASLNRSYKILALAADLGIRPSADPVRDILAYCEKRVRRFLRDFPDCRTLAELLDIVASKLGTRFEVINSDEELLEVRDRYARLGERSFASLPDDLDEDVLGITFRRIAKRPWEPPFVSVIDCRGDKCFRSYYTKWHELGHLLTLTDQMRLSFRRTHAAHDYKDPEESMVDVIASTFGYFKDIIRPMANGALSWDNIEAVRARSSPESSQQAAVIGIVKSWPVPALLVQAALGLKRGEKRRLAQAPLTSLTHPFLCCAPYRSHRTTRRGAAISWSSRTCVSPSARSSTGYSPGNWTKPRPRKISVGGRAATVLDCHRSRSMCSLAASGMPCQHCIASTGVTMFRILSLDGGGIRGAFAAAFLHRLERQIGCPISDYFDLIAGTSTGGIIALALCLGEPAEKICNLYRDAGSAIFARRGSGDLSTWRRMCARAAKWKFRSLDKATGCRSKYTTDTLREILAAVFGTRTLEDHCRSAR